MDRLNCKGIMDGLKTSLTVHTVGYARFVKILEFRIFVTMWWKYFGASNLERIKQLATLKKFRICFSKNKDNDDINCVSVDCRCRHVVFFNSKRSQMDPWTKRPNSKRKMGAKDQHSKILKNEKNKYSNA